MNKKKLIILAGIASIVLIGGRILIARSFLSGESNSLQNNIITSPALIEENVHAGISNTNETIIPKKLTSTGRIDIAVPHFLSLEALEQLSENINEDDTRNITVTFTQATSLANYQRMIQEESNNFDLILMPSIWIESFGNSLAFPLDQSVSSLFHPNIGDMVLESNIRTIPLILDPHLTISTTPMMQADSSVFTWIDIEKTLLKSKDPDQLLLGFGIGSVERSNLPDLWHPLPGYLQTLELLVASSISSSNHQLLFQLLDTPLRDVKKMLTTAIQTGAEMCKKNVLLCLIDQKKLAVGFSSMSEVNYHIAESPLLYPLPDQSGLTTTVWSFISPVNNNNKEIVLSRILGYLQTAPSSTVGLWKDTLSVFNAPLQQQLLETKYAAIKSYIQKNNLIITQGKQHNVKSWFEETNFPKVLDGSYSTKIFIETEHQRGKKD